MTNAPILKGPKHPAGGDIPLLNTNFPEPFAWRTHGTGWILTTTGANDVSYNGTWTARSPEDTEAGVYRMVGRDDRWMNRVVNYSDYWSMGSALVTDMPGDYYRPGTLEAGPPEGQWDVGYNSGPGPTLTRASAALSGVFRWQIAAFAEEAAPDDAAWSEPTTDTTLVPTGLADGDYLLFVQERVDDTEWSDTGQLRFTVGAVDLPAPVIAGPDALNTTFGKFGWNTGKSKGKRITVSGFGAYNSYYADYDGVYMPHGETPGVWKHTENSRYFFYLQQWSSYYGRYYNYWVFNTATGTTMQSPAYLYLGDGVAGDPENPPLSGGWSGDMGPGITPVMSHEELLALTGRFRHRFVEVATNAEVGPKSDDTTARAVTWTDIPLGDYRLEVAELVSADRELPLWTPAATFAFTATRNAIPAPTVTGVTPTDIFAPTLFLRSNAPGPERFVAYNAGTRGANGVYAEAGTLNGYKRFKRIDADYYCFNGREYDSRQWAIYGDPASEWAPSPQADSDYNWPYPRWYYNYNGITADGGPPENNWYRADGVDPAPTLKYGNYADGQGTGQFRFRVDGGAWSETVTGTSFTLPEQASGVHAVEAQELGENGLWSDSGAFDVDTSLIPAPTVNADPAASDGGWHVYFTWSRNSGNRGTDNYRYRLNGGPWYECGTVKNIRSLGQFPSGTNTFEVEEKSTTGGWSATGIREVTVTGGLQGGQFAVPRDARVVIVDAAGREYLWTPNGRLSSQYGPLLEFAGGEAPAMNAAPPAALSRTEPSPEPESVEGPFIFVTSTDRYHTADCPYGQTGERLTAQQIRARAGVPCQHCNPPPLE